MTTPITPAIHSHDVLFSKASACYLPKDSSFPSHLPSATATAVDVEELSSPMFIEAEHIVCYGDFDPFIDSGVEIQSEAIAEADAVHEITEGIPTDAWPECYDAVLVKKEKYDPFDNLKEDFLSDELLFAEIIDDIAECGFEEEKQETVIQAVDYSAPAQLFEDPFFNQYSSDDLSEHDFFLQDFTSSDQELNFSIGGPKPVDAMTPMSDFPLNRHPNLHQTIKQQQLPPLHSSLSSRYPPKPVRERELSLQKHKDKREEKLNDARSPDARQVATAKRERTNGKFAKRKINWVSITDVV
jgi:hypothetical protein